MMSQVMPVEAGTAHSASLLPSLSEPVGSKGITFLDKMGTFSAH